MRNRSSIKTIVIRKATVMLQTRLNRTPPTQVLSLHQVSHRSEEGVLESMLSLPAPWDLNDVSGIPWSLFHADYYRMCWQEQQELKSRRSAPDFDLDEEEIE